jgi:hypothetical protein
MKGSCSSGWGVPHSTGGAKKLELTHAHALTVPAASANVIKSNFFIEISPSASFVIISRSKRQERFKTNDEGKDAGFPAGPRFQFAPARMASCLRNARMIVGCVTP